MNKPVSILLTGMGAITARGDRTLHNISDANRRKSAAPASAEPAAPEFTLSDFVLEEYLASPKTYLDRCSALSLAACALALEDAGFTWPLNTEKFGIALGTHFGCIETMKLFWSKAAEKGMRLANPLLFSHSYFNSPISLCAIEFGLKGYHGTFCAHEHSGTEAVRAAFDAIRLGHAEAMLCGGVDAVTPAREMFVPQGNAGEAAVFFVLESESHTRRRGAESTLEPGESWFEAASDLEEVRSQFGDCAGALGALALAQQLPK